MRAVVVAAGLLLLGACSSKNPDSLIGKNFDENLAMMDANAASEANATAEGSNSNFESARLPKPEPIAEAAANQGAPKRQAEPEQPPAADAAGQPADSDENAEPASAGDDSADNRADENQD